MKRTLLYPVFLFFYICALYSQEPPDALAYYNEGKYNQAVEICLEELKITPRNLDSFTVLCWSLVESGRYQEALDYSQKANSIAPNDYRILEVLGEAYYFTGDNLHALSSFERYITIVSLIPGVHRKARAYYFMGETFMRLGEYHHADTAFSTAVVYDPSNVRWWTKAGLARHNSKEYSLAVEAFDNALKLNPNFQDALRGKETSLAALGR